MEDEFDEIINNNINTIEQKKVSKVIIEKTLVEFSEGRITFNDASEILLDFSSEMTKFSIRQILEVK